MARLQPIPLAEPEFAWPGDLHAAQWPAMRADIRERMLGILGDFPSHAPALQVTQVEEQDAGGYRRIKIAYPVECDDRAVAWLLRPLAVEQGAPAVLALHPSTRGTGKDRVVGLAGRYPGSPPDPNRSYAVDLVKAGYVVLAPDVWGDGERLPSSGICRDTRELYHKHPDWSYLGKLVWDWMRAVDVLASLPEVDSNRIGVAGHSLGGLGAIFTALFDDRVRVVVANGSPSHWCEKHQLMHWALDDSEGRINCFVKRLRPYLAPDKWRTIPVQWHEILAMAAPRPFLDVQAGQCPHDDPKAHWDHYGGLHASCRRIYRLLDAEGLLGFVRTSDAHSFPPEARRMMVRWFQDHL